MLDLADGGGHCLVVNGTAISLEISHPGLASEKTGQELVRYWLDRCDDFMDQQRENLIEREPSPRELAQHIDSLKFMVRVTLSLQALVADPDSPTRRFAQEISGKLLQLQASLELFLNPMTDAEADTVLAAQALEREEAFGFVNREPLPKAPSPARSSPSGRATGSPGSQPPRERHGGPV